MTYSFGNWFSALKQGSATRFSYLSNGLYPGDKHLDPTQFVQYLETQAFMLVGRVGMNRIVDVNRHYLFKSKEREDVIFSASLSCVVNAMNWVVGEGEKRGEWMNGGSLGQVCDVYPREFL